MHVCELFCCVVTFFVSSYCSCVVMDSLSCVVLCCRVCVCVCVCVCACVCVCNCVCVCLHVCGCVLTRKNDALSLPCGLVCGKALRTFILVHHSVGLWWHVHLRCCVRVLRCVCEKSVRGASENKPKKQRTRKIQPSRSYLCDVCACLLHRAGHQKSGKWKN